MIIKFEKEKKTKLLMGTPNTYIYIYIKKTTFCFCDSRTYIFSCMNMNMNIKFWWIGCSVDNELSKLIISYETSKRLDTCEREYNETWNRIFSQDRPINFRITAFDEQQRSLIDGTSRTKLVLNRYRWRVGVAWASHYASKSPDRGNCRFWWHNSADPDFPE